MNLVLVEDIAKDQVLDANYDLGIFACGYEQRAIELAGKIVQKQKIKTILTLCFSDKRDTGFRRKNDVYFDSITQDKIHIGSDEEAKIYNYLTTYVKQCKNKSLKILVDYSCMSRLWYVSIINWIRYSELDLVQIDFSYSIGEYIEELKPLVIKGIHALPGYEGVTTNPNTISVFGLGFDSLSTLCVLDKLEPYRIHSFAAIPIHKEYENKAEEYNKEFIENYSDTLQYYPLVSIEKTYRLMSELIVPYRGAYNISFIPMGPKPHILASILLATKYNEVINIYVKGERELPPNVIASGEFICTKVIFEK